MRHKKVIRTTLGELIVAVTDEVRPFVNDTADLYIATSSVLNDLLAHHQLPGAKKSRRMNSTCFPKASH